MTYIRNLLAMRKRHGAETPIGHRCSNLVEKFKALKECQDQARRIRIIQNMRREVAEIAVLQSQR